MSNQVPGRNDAMKQDRDLNPTHRCEGRLSLLVAANKPDRYQQRGKRPNHHGSLREAASSSTGFPPSKHRRPSQYHRSTKAPACSPTAATEVEFGYFLHSFSQGDERVSISRDRLHNQR